MILVGSLQIVLGESFSHIAIDASYNVGLLGKNMKFLDLLDLC